MISRLALAWINMVGLIVDKNETSLAFELDRPKVFEFTYFVYGEWRIGFNTPIEVNSIPYHHPFRQVRKHITNTFLGCIFFYQGYFSHVIPTYLKVVN